MEKRTTPFTGEDCCRTMYQEVPNGMGTNEGLIAILKMEYFHPDYQTPDNQLFRLKCGFGCSPTTGGNACFGVYCLDGEEARQERFQFIGIANEEVTKYAEELESKWQQNKQREAEM